MLQCKWENVTCELLSSTMVRERVFLYILHALCMFVWYMCRLWPQSCKLHVFGSCIVHVCVFMCVVGLCHRDVRYMLLDCGEKIQLNSHQLNKYVRLVRACVLVVEVVDYTRPQGVYGHVDYVWKDTHLQCLLWVRGTFLLTSKTLETFPHE